MHVKLDRKIIDWKADMTDAETKQGVSLDGDVVFKWSGYSNVYQLPDKEAFDDCDFSKATKLASYDENPYTYKASSAGIFYFTCGAVNRCALYNQKLALTVTGHHMCVGMFVLLYVCDAHMQL